MQSDWFKTCESLNIRLQTLSDFMIAFIKKVIYITHYLTASGLNDTDDTLADRNELLGQISEQNINTVRIVWRKEHTSVFNYKIGEKNYSLSFTPNDTVINLPGQRPINAITILGDKLIQMIKALQQYHYLVYEVENIDTQDQPQRMLSVRI